MFFTPSGAKAYIEQKAMQFYALKPVIESQLASAARLKLAAMRAGNLHRVAELQTLYTKILASMQKHMNLALLLEKVIPAPSGLGQMLAIGGFAAVGLAVGMYEHFRTIQEQQQALDLLSAGRITGDQAVALTRNIGGSVLADIGTIMSKGTYLALAGVAVAGLYLAWPYLSKLSKSEGSSEHA